MSEYYYTLQSRLTLCVLCLLSCAGFIVRWLPRLKGKLQGTLFDDVEYWDVSERGEREGGM